MLYNFDEFRENNKWKIASTLKPNDVIRRLDDRSSNWCHYKVLRVTKHYTNYQDIEEDIIDANKTAIIFKVTLSSRALPTTRKMKINKLSELQVLDAEEAMCIREPTSNDKYVVYPTGRLQ